MIPISEDFTLIVNDNFGHMSIEIYGQLVQGNRLYIIGYDGEGLIQQEITRENEMNLLTTFKPLLKISRFMLPTLLKGFADYANKKDIHTENENLLKGKLTATETHLADMRELSKKLTDHLIK
jgi:hypothetical protein